MDKKDKDIKFEDKLQELEAITKELESDELTLDDSITKFETGMKISKECKEILDGAEKRITILIDGKEQDFIQEEE